ncbi:MAG: bifunctional adenosylcobinamide kinase/adenosylcobinamide-phosphate guanylyltransferase [Magnetococcales bacterium]|nr:bifunctional adenosylcobinamide kinase/adenosylcobinamide-phosphate guanylyltransferase [Magnetococcales bacterium]NGZ04899.1 bifunctional adenosylcobinamide kinase/adenosylcobinamide-phosphate guanylyltransferase [Magnetococcales bacterium]
MSVHLILGGARSGKSAMAAQLARGSGLNAWLIATARAEDAEMAARIARHRTERSEAAWQVVEEPVRLAHALLACSRRDRFVVVDCLTLWLTNLLLDPDGEQRFPGERQALLDAVSHLPGPVVLVSNETGLGVVPMGAIARRFVDESGWLHQELARRCDRVTLMVAGLPFNLKGAVS